MDKLTYEQRVRNMAKALVHTTHIESDYESWYERMIVNATPSAKIAVAAQAEAIREYIECGLTENSLAPSVDKYLIENGYEPAPEVKKCDHQGCQRIPSSTNNEPIYSCCGGYVNTVMTEDEKREEKQQIYDAADLNIHKVKERSYLCYNKQLECDGPRACIIFNRCAYSPENEQK